MGRAYYRFGHDIALRLSDGQAFALQDAELGAIFDNESVPTCFLRGIFTAGSYRGLLARGLLPPNPELQALAQPVAVQLNLMPEWTATIGKDAATLHQIGRRLDQNSLTDSMARKLLMFDAWQLQSAVAASSKTKQMLTNSTPSIRESVQETAFTELITDMASELWVAAEAAGVEAVPPPLEKPIALEEAIAIFFEEEAWEAVSNADNHWHTVYDGDNGSWMCYIRILPDLEQVTFYSICPVSVPAFSVATMIEFLCRVNAELSLGNFELDFDLKLVRFRTGVDVTDVGLAPLLFRNLVFHNLAVMDIYLPEMLRIIAGKQSALPADA